MPTIIAGGLGWSLEIIDGPPPAVAWNLVAGPARGLNGTGIAAVLAAVSAYMSAGKADAIRGLGGGPQINVNVSGGVLPCATGADARAQATALAAVLGVQANNF